ncbi:peroxidase 57-like [Dorcoceras hygrometricum]|uniref:Peroxidase n=1 Tax=Dorcoceras hygrometricum TaxID=472368 RepID=A0A2Z7CZP3_9LAMI|nr:peroxidase 57-like [Dorcoceras hygrometricum]
MAARGRMIAATFGFCSLIISLLASASETTIPSPKTVVSPSDDHGQEIVHNEPGKRVLLDNVSSGGDECEGEPAAIEPRRLIQGFYHESCPQAEQIVNEVFMKNLQADNYLAPAIVRLFTHDCLVKGCDASILLANTPEGKKVEKNSAINGPFIRGYEVIDEMKARLEAECPGVVSCADILAFANRDALVQSGVPAYEVAAGRRDGRSSLATNVMNNVPILSTPAQGIIEIFNRKGLSLEDLIVLDGAHSIGGAHCVNVRPRISDDIQAREMDPSYVDRLRSMCENINNTVPLDPATPNKMDVGIYDQFLRNNAVLPPDDALAKEPNANAIMKKLAGDQEGWLAKFVLAVIKMGEIEVLTGDQGEIRRDCRAVN